MSKTLDVSYPREYTMRDGSKKTHWMKCGVAFQNDKHCDVILYVVPPATQQTDGSMGVRFQLREPFPKDDEPRTSRPMVEHKRIPSKPQPSADNDDPLPF